MTEIPNTTVTCDGCGQELYVLRPYVKVQIKVERQVLGTDVATLGEDPVFHMGTQSGAGDIFTFHNFKCVAKYVNPLKDDTVELKPHLEEGPPYVPEDNRSPEELAKAGEITAEHAAILTGGES